MLPSLCSFAGNIAGADWGILPPHFIPASFEFEVSSSKSGSLVAQRSVGSDASFDLMSQRKQFYPRNVVKRYNFVQPLPILCEKVAYLSIHKVSPKQFLLPI